VTEHFESLSTLRRTVSYARAAVAFIQAEQEYALADGEMVLSVRSLRQTVSATIEAFEQLRANAKSEAVRGKCAPLILELERLSSELAEVDDGRTVIDRIC